MSIVRHAALMTEALVMAHFTVPIEALLGVALPCTVRHENSGFPVSQTFQVQHECVEAIAGILYKPGPAAGRVAPGLAATASGRGGN